MQISKGFSFWCSNDGPADLWPRRGACYKEALSVTVFKVLKYYSEILRTNSKKMAC